MSQNLNLQLYKKMKAIYKKISLVTIILLCSLHTFGQIYGEELIINGTFGTSNDPGNLNTTKNIYPTIQEITNGTISPYYQIPEEVFHNGSLIRFNINPGVVIGPPLVGKDDNSINYQTEYLWGFTEPWESEAYNFPTTANPPQDSRRNIPHAPNNGYYTIATSTKGMYSLPTLSTISWYETYDRYEINKGRPTNMFLIVNADTQADKVFYKQAVTVTPGQLYRMSVDLAQLNLPTAGASPNLNFFINPDPAVGAQELTHPTGLLPSDGQWATYHFDYVAPCYSSNYTANIAFRNEVAGGNGNDIALDNLSMRPIYPQIKSTIIRDDTNCIATLQLDGSIAGALDESRFIFQWQQLESNTWTTLPGQQSRTYSTSTAGVYRVAIYTAETASCPMFSNNVILAYDEGNNCLQDLSPTAEDDSYSASPDVRMEVNILDNDQVSAPEVSRSTLKVLAYKIGTNKIPAGTSTMLINPAGTDTIGALNIQNDGTLTFHSLPNYFGDIPQIEYIITDSNGGRDSAMVNIDILVHTIIVGDYCAYCPADITILSPTLVNGSVYNLYHRDSNDLLQAQTATDNSLVFNFKETQSGVIYYTLTEANTPEESLIHFRVMVGPYKATWMPNLVIGSSDWNEIANWQSTTGGGFPYWCTDVVIPSNARYFPQVISDFDYRCRDITFQSGASVGQIHKLSYRRAYIEYTPAPDTWSMLSAPLKYTYSADFHADPTWGDGAAVDPKIYMRYFDVGYLSDNLANPDDSLGYSLGGFSRTFANLKQELANTQGFVLNIGSSEQNHFSGTYRFPRMLDDGSEVTYMYHYTDNGEWITDDSAGEKYAPFQLPRGTTPMDSATWAANNMDNSFYSLRGEDTRYRFIFENNNTDVVSSFTISGLHAGTTNIIGNPFMSHLDFNAFVEDNEAYVQPYYRTFDGTNFHSYLSTTGERDNAVWEGLDGITTSETQQATQLIRPMHSFFVQMKDGQTTLTFNSDNIATIPPYIPAPKSEPQGIRARATKNTNVLKLKLSIGQNSNSAILASLERASDSYTPDEDISKLFIDGQSIRTAQSTTPAPIDIYTISDGHAIEINAISQQGKEKIIPIGIKASQNGPATLSIEGVETFSAYPYLYLIDAKEGKTYNLAEQASIDFEKETSEIVEGRFYIVMNDAPTSDPVTNEENINVFVRDGRINISTPVNKISQIRLYDISGKIIFSRNNLQSNYENISPMLATGIYLLQVNTNTGVSEFKIRL